jgi:hypothetical protein
VISTTDPYGRIELSKRDYDVISTVSTVGVYGKERLVRTQLIGRGDVAGMHWHYKGGVELQAVGERWVHNAVVTVD